MKKLFLVLLAVILGVSSPLMNPHTAYADEPWQVETVDSTPTSGEDSSLKLNASGNPCIAYHTSYDTGLKYAYFDGSGWQFQELALGHIWNGWVNSLAIDSLGRPCVSYINSGHRDLYYTVGTGDINLIRMDAAELNKDRSSLALDSSDVPYIAYNFPNYGSPVLLYTWWNGSSWVDQTVDTGDTGYCSMARESNGHAHISYTNGSWYLKYAYYNGSSWTTQLVDTAAQFGYTSIALDAVGRPHISYYDFTNLHLKYAWWNGLSWQIETVDDSPWVGQCNSLALDSSGRPGISYYDEKNGDLKYAHWNGSGWDVFSVDTVGNVGKWTSLAIDSSNTPHISYWDQTNGTLKYARLASGLRVTNSSGASEVTSTTARLSGNLLDTGGLDTTVHIYWGELDGGTVPSAWGHEINLGVLPAGSFSVTISSLAPAVRHYYRCYVENSMGQCWAPLTSSFITNLVGNWVTMDIELPVSFDPYLNFPSLASIWGSSGTDIFAVGDGGVILHYDGITWTTMNSGTINNLRAVWGSSGTDVFAVGEWGAILHYNGTHWTTMDSGTSYHFKGVWGSSGTDVFAVGSSGTILHYDGITWTTMNSGTPFPLTAVWGTSASNVYVVGYHNGLSRKNTVLHYDGSIWSPMDCGTQRDLCAIWGSSASDIYTTGTTGSMEYGPTTYHYDGSAWSPIKSGYNGKTIWGIGPNDIYLISQDSYGRESIGHYDGLSWSEISLGREYGLSGFWGTGANNIFVVGWPNRGGRENNWVVWKNFFWFQCGIYRYTGGGIRPPSVTTALATSVGGTTATLNGNLVNDGGEASQYRFEWDADSGEPYTNHTEWVGSKTSGESFSEAISGLPKGTLVYFRAQSRNSAGTSSSALELAFITQPDPPTGVTASEGDRQISLSWTKGDGASRTLIVMKTGGYPTGMTDGTQIYLDAGTSYIDTELTNGTTYYYCFWSEVSLNGLQQYSDTCAKIEAAPQGPEAPLAVTTNDATNVSGSGAQLNGNLDSLGGSSSVNVYFGYGNTPGGPYPQSTLPQNVNSLGAFSAILTNLNSSTTYYYIAFANGTAHGLEKSFTTNKVIPTITTTAATGTSTNSATLNISYDFKDYSSGSVQFAYKRTADSTWTFTAWQAKSGMGTYSESISGLASNTEYQLKARLKYDSTEIEGSVLTFTTNKVIPTVTTGVATDITASSATLNMTYDFKDAGSGSVCFAYKKTTDADWALTSWVTKSGAGTYAEAISGLASNTDYKFKARLTYNSTEIEGAEQFVVVSIVRTDSATNITTTTATLNMTYDFKDAGSGSVQFAYKATTDAGWTYTTWQTKSGAGTYAEPLSGLASNTTYQFKAQLKKINAVVIGGLELTFTTSATQQLPRLVFISNRDGNDEVYSMYINGTGQTRLTDNPAKEAGPALSPDGTKIAFTSWRDGNPEIYVMNAADGSSVTRLTINSAWDIWPAWSPYGTRIAFVSQRDGNSEIYVMNADGTGQSRLTNNLAEDILPTWSPDDAKIAFTSDRDGNVEIYVMNANGSGVTRLTNNAATDHWPAWSPDGTKLAFMSTRDGDAEIYVMNTDGTGQVNVTNNLASDTQPTWISLSVGNKIAFTSWRDGNPEIYTVFADGTSLFRLTNNNIGDFTRGMGWSTQTTTNDADNIVANSAKLNGNLDSLGLASSVNVSFVWGTAPGSYTHETTAVLMNAVGAFSFNLPDLAPGSTYYFRAKAVNDSYDWGAEKSFTTAVLPSVTTNSAANILANTATLNGILTNLGTATTVNVLFHWGTVSGQVPLPNSTTPLAMTVPGAFSFNLTNLTPGTTYYFRAVASGPYGYSPGAEMSFTPDNIAPTTTISLTGTPGNNGWYKSDVTIILAATDNPGGSGIAKTEYSFDNTNWTTYTSVFAITTEGTTTVYYRSTDKAGNIESAKSQTIKIDKTPPVITVNLPVPYGLYIVGTTLNFQASDGISGIESLSGNLNNGTTVIQVQSGYVLPVGVYTLTVTAVDKAGNGYTSDSITFVVYDPNGGFVTGGGWFTSPAGAYSANQTLTGKATFGFVSKYQKGANIPTGQTEFQFHVANLNFHSESYDWLVVASTKAQYKGTGTITGLGGTYRFMLTAIDGDLLAGGKGADKFRIRIWDDNGLIYDNQMGKDENGDFATEIQGGSIVIHK